MTTDNYDPSTSKRAYYPSGSDRLARLWTREANIHDLADIGAVEFFEGGGSNATLLSGWSKKKLWLRADAGVTPSTGEVRYYNGSDPTQLSSWPVLASRAAFVAHLGANGQDFDFAFTSATSGDPGDGRVLASASTLSAATSINVSVTGRSGQSYGARIAAWTTGDRIIVYELTNEENFFDARVASAPVNHGTYYTVPITVIASSTIANATILGLGYSATNASVGDVSFNELYERQGNRNRLRNTYGVLSALNRKGYTGPSNADFLPTTQNLSQSGTTVTCASAIFTADHVGKIIEWDSGEEAIITAVPRTAASLHAAVTTATVDRSQTVALGSSRMNAKSFTECIFGNSVSHPVMRRLIAQRWREIGFGGYVFSAGNVDTTVLSIAEVNYTGGAAATTTSSDYATAPWSSWFSIPSAGTATFNMNSSWSNGVFRLLSHTLQEEALQTDTFTLVWKRAAGALTIQRRREWDANWETAGTIADTNAGSDVFMWKRYKHTLGAGWQYRITSSGGTTVKVMQVSLLNRTTPGYVPWTLYTSGNNVTNFMLMSAADWAKIVIPTNIDLVTFHMQQSASLVSGAGWSGDYANFRAMWVTASGTRPLDFFWISGWEPADDQVAAKAQGDALRTHALAYDDGYLSMYSLFGDYTTQSFARGWIKDSIHPSEVIGSELASAVIERAAGLSQHPNVRHGRSVDAPSVSADTMSLRTIDVGTRLSGHRQRWGGAKWNTGDHGAFVSTGGLSSAISTSEFTFTIDMDVLSSVPAVQYLLVANNSAAALATANGIEIVILGAELRIVLRDGSSNYDYKFANFGKAYGSASGTRRYLVIRSDRTNGRFDIFVDGIPAFALVGTVSGAGTTLPTWSGVGTDIGIPQGSNASNSSRVYAMGFWRSALTDAEIKSNMDAALPATAPDVFLTFDTGVGRVALDRSGNGKHAVVLKSNPNQYNITSAVTWGIPKRGLAPAWATTVNATTVLVAGDDVIAKYSTNTDMQLPATPSVGDVVRVTRNTTSTVKLSQAALHQIKLAPGTSVGTDATTIGTSGKLTVTGGVTVVCSRAEAGVAYEWSVTASAGTLTYV